jgi:hypothetical protein
LGAIFKDADGIKRKSAVLLNRRGALLTVKELLGHSSITATKRDRGASRESKRRSVAVLARSGLETSSFPSGEERNRIAANGSKLSGR